MSSGRTYINNENGMKVILNAIHWKCFFVKLNVIKKLCDRSGTGKRMGRTGTLHINKSVMQTTAFAVRQQWGICVCNCSSSLVRKCSIWWKFDILLKCKFSVNCCLLYKMYKTYIKIFSKTLKNIITKSLSTENTSIVLQNFQKRLFAMLGQHFAIWGQSTKLKKNFCKILNLFSPWICCFSAL